MFGFMKRDREDKERKKREKEEKEQKRTSTKSLTAEELARLEESKRNLQKKSDADSSSQDRNSSTTSNESVGRLASPARPSSGKGRLSDTGRSSLVRSGGAAPPPTYPKPPKKGILKDKSSYGQPVPNHGVRGSLDDTVTLEENTLANEILSGAVDGAAAVVTPAGTVVVPTVSTPFSAVASSTQSSAEKTHIQKASSQRRSKPSVSVKRSPSKPLGSIPRPSVPVVARPPSPVDKSYDQVNLQLPDVAPPICPLPRELVISRQPAGDFGFTLRKGVILERIGSGGDDPDERKRTVIFAEPGLKQSTGGLLPGDRLIEVNGFNVEEATRESIIDLIKKSGENVRLKVQPIPELCELSMRSAGHDLSNVTVSGEESVSGSVATHTSGTLQRSGSLRYRSRQAKTEEQLATDKAFMLAEKVWLVHKGGFAAARILRPGMPGGEGAEKLPEGKCRVKLEHGGEVLDVDEEDVEKANPPQFDRVEDLAMLRYLNESCILHTLRQRYAGNLVHSYAGQSLVVINPMHPLSIYSEKVIQMFRGCKPEDMPPHIYATAQTAYRNLLSSRRDQSIVLTGRSGSGKTANARHVMQYYVTAAGCVGNVLTVEKLVAVHMLLDTFGGSRTISNTSTTNYTQITTFDFDHSGQIVSASVQAMMLEKSRLVRRPEGEPTFHVFYQMLAGIDEAIRKDLFLDNLDTPNPLMTPLQRTEDRQRATQTWLKVCQSVAILKITESELKAICSVLAAIYHIGAAGATRGVNNKYQFADPVSAKRVADILGTTVDELSRTIFSSGSSSSATSLSPAYRPPADKEPGSSETVNGMEALEGFVVGLYSEAFQAIVTLINRSLSSNYRVMASIMIVDTPGFRNPATCGRSTGATFEDFCHNYVQERLQLLFHDTVFTSKQDLYSQENINCDFEPVTSSPAPLVLLIDMPQSTMIRSPGQDGRDLESRGMLWLLDEEALSPGSSDEAFLELVFHIYGEDDGSGRGALLKPGTVPGTFVLNHFQGTNPVQYNVKGWLRACRENAVTRSVGSLLQESKKDEISGLFVVTSRSTVATTITGSVAGLEGGTSLRRVSSMRRTFTSGLAGVKRRSVCVQVKYQTDSLMELLRRTSIHFVHCILPQHNAGLCDLKTAMTPASNLPASAAGGKPTSRDEVMINVPLVRSQIRGVEIVDAVRFHRQGFPEHLQFVEFRRRYELLVPPNLRHTGAVVDEKQAMEQLLENLEIDSTSFRLGLSQVFFRAGGLGRLEDLRDEKLTDWVVRLQTVSRGYLGRKYCQKLKLQHVAAACIQRNIRKLMRIREWPWWRLYTKVKPLLNVHRTEEELRDREYELDQLKQKLEKSEKERNEYKQMADRLETKLAELAADFQDEHSTSTQAAEMLEHETSERIHLEKELKDLQGKYSQLQQQHQRTEMELMDVHMMSASVEHELDDEDDNEAESALRERFERTRREAEFAKKKLQQQHEEQIEEFEAAKKALERKLAESNVECEAQGQQAGGLRRKLQRLNQDMADLRLQLEEQAGRNTELEKKQRKFDVELAKVNESLRTEKQQREKLQRERDEALAHKYTADQELKGLKMDVEMHVDKIQRLERELNDLTLSEKDDKEALKLRQARNELERKVQDQEEELDEQAGTIQQLEQAKLKLEMAQEKLRQQHAKELDEKELDMEAAKVSAQKKVRAVELQLEEEHDEKQKLQREKRELERRIQTLGEQKPARDRDVEHMLRRDLRRTKALLQDAQMMLQRNKDGAGSRITVKQLRNQLDDAELTTAAALKAKKAMEAELQDLHHQLDAMTKAKQEADDKCVHVSREKNELQNHMDEVDEEVAELMKKYKAAVQQHSVDLITFQDQSKQIETLMNEKEALSEQIVALQNKLDFLENSTVDREVVVRLEAKIRDLEAKHDFEQITRQRAETQLTRVKEQLEQDNDERQSQRAEESRTQEQMRRLQRQNRELEDELNDLKRKESDSTQRKLDVEKKLESLEEEYERSQSDLQLAFKRISDLQATIADDLMAESDEEGHSSEEGGSDYNDAAAYVTDSDGDDDDDDSPSPRLVSRKLSVPASTDA